jgi:para-aminobenzoate synthetase / 4-amino-4-deoxychorismate lyase
MPPVHQTPIRATSDPLTVPPYSSEPGDVIMVSGDRLRRFHDPVEIVEAACAGDVIPALDRLATLVEEGCTVAGYVAYEAAAAFDTAMVTHAVGDAPVLWFAAYERWDDLSVPACGAETGAALAWESSLDDAAFGSSLDRIREYISAGDTYQVNFTFPLSVDYSGEVLPLFYRLCRGQEGAYQTYIDTGRSSILSLSPELFFRLDGSRLTTRPMKGTAKRGLSAASDREQAEALARSEKDRAENVMIVDLVRNDMGRISETGTVQVERRFDVERYPTLWQMTSTITSETHATVPDIFAALFPSGSVTGAPKIRTMEIIRELESGPRGVYCGAVGWWGPDRQAEFNVAIRTATVDNEAGRMTYPVGAGITWESASDSEYEECLLKAKVLNEVGSKFELLESLLWDGDFFLLERHLARLRESAGRFGFDFDDSRIRSELEQCAAGLGIQPAKVRLLLSKRGSVVVEAQPMEPVSMQRVALAAAPVDNNDVFLYHKTTNRGVYDRAMKDAPGMDDVLLWNRRGELTESTRANVAVKLDGAWLTPPVESGLLAGTYRSVLIEEDKVSERRILVEDLERAEKICLFNSVRKWMDTDWVTKRSL